MAERADLYPTYQLEPDFSKRFPPLKVKKLIGEVLKEKLKGVEYSPDTMSEMTKDIAEDVKSRLKDMGLNRYKIVVQVVIGEQRGEGVQMGTRSFWDSSTDDYACELYINESIFCMAAAFGIYFY